MNVYCEMLVCVGEEGRSGRQGLTDLLSFRSVLILLFIRIGMLTLNKQTKQYNFALPDCHNKLNEYGKLSLLTKEKSFRDYYHTRALTESRTLPKDHNKQPHDSLSKLLLQKTDRSLQKKLNPELEHQLEILKEMKLDSPRELKQIRYEGHIKIPTIHNDYHSRATNHGYSRSQSGGIFPK